MPRNPDRTGLCHFTYSDAAAAPFPSSPTTSASATITSRSIAPISTPLQPPRAPLETGVHSHSNLIRMLSALFRATASDHIKPRTATRLTCRARTPPAIREPRICCPTPSNHL